MKEKKSNGDDKILKQDMSQTADHPGMVFMVHLLMEEKCGMPERQRNSGNL